MKDTLTMGSLFDGSGGFPLGGVLNGIKPLWSSEIEPFPIRVTTKRFPNAKHYGDVSKIDGAKLEPVDIVTYGSPCQDISIAGLRKGLAGKRSNLFYQAVRIMEEMRAETNGKYPRFAVWENVPGAFSSNKGEDFRCVLEALCKVKDPLANVPMPEKGKWTGVGNIMGDTYSIAWRTLDAQYWGVPQRRKRIYLVADFDGQRAGKILFESEGVSGYSAESFRAWQDSTGSVEGGIGETGTICLNDQGGQRMDVTKDIVAPLRAMANHPPIVLNDKRNAISVENHGADSRVRIREDGKVQTLSSAMGTGGNNVPLVLESNAHGAVAFGICSKDSNSMKSPNPFSGFYKAETSRTLDTNGGNPSCSQGGVCIVDTATYGLDRAAFNQGKNAKFGIAVERELEPPLVSRGPNAIAHSIYSANKTSYFTKTTKDVTGPLVATDYKDPPLVYDDNEYSDYIVRRLTPTECARLQGFPDWWCDGLETENPSKDDIEFWKGVFETHRQTVGTSTKPKSEKQIIKWLKNPCSDSAMYKMWGNGVALPNVCFVMAGIRYFADT